MHEEALFIKLLKKIEIIAEENQADKVTKVKIQLGALSYFSKEQFIEHLYIESKGTIAEGAELDVYISQDLYDPHAQDIMLKRVDVRKP